MTGASTIRLFCRLLQAALLLVVQSLHAESVPATQPSMPSPTASEAESGSDAEKEKRPAPPVAEVAPISVPVSDAVKEAALLMRPSGATLDQVVAAMVILNPAVFAHGDLQHVAFSSPLNVPSTQEILREDPAGLALLLLQIDIVAAVSPLAGFNERASSPQVVVRRQEHAPAADGIMPAGMPAPQTAAEGSMIPGSTVLIGLSVALLLFSLMWLLFRFGTDRGCQPLSASSNVATTEEKSALLDEWHRSQLYNLPDDYLNYDDIEALLQRLVGDFPDASRQVLQLMHLFRMRRDREGFLRQHQHLLDSGFYQRHAEMRSVINQDAAELGLQLNAVTAAKDAISSAERMQQLQERVVMAENATRAAEKRATKAELTLKKMQLQLDFGETDNDSR